MSREVISRLYEAFAVRDHAAMAHCYTSDARFTDPVFTDLRGTQVAAMWRLLCQRATDLRISYSDISADGNSGAAHWEAWYTYSATGRPVHNVIEAAFTFRDGLIATHRDHFDLYLLDPAGAGHDRCLTRVDPGAAERRAPQSGCCPDPLQRFLMNVPSCSSAYA